MQARNLRVEFVFLDKYLFLFYFLTGIVDFSMHARIKRARLELAQPAIAPNNTRCRELFDLTSVVPHLPQNLPRMLPQMRRMREIVARRWRALAAEGSHRHAAKRVVLDPVHRIDRLHLRVGEEIVIRGNLWRLTPKKVQRRD